MLIDIKPRISKPPFGSVLVDKTHELANGLVGCWLMNHGRGVVRDISSFNPPALTGIPTGTVPAAGPRWMGLTFGGAATDTVKVPNTVLIQSFTTLSLVVWARRVGAGGANKGKLLDKGTAAGPGVGDFSFYDDDVAALIHFLSARWSTTTGDWTTPEPTINVLHHFVITYDTRSTTNVPSMYIDGVAKTVTTATAPVGTSTTSTQDMFIGNRSDGLRNWNGQISYVAMYNRILTPADVLWLFGEPFAFLLPIPSMRYWSSPIAAAAVGSVVRPRSLALLGVGS